METIYWFLKKVIVSGIVYPLVLSIAVVHYKSFLRIFIYTNNLYEVEEHRRKGWDMCNSYVIANYLKSFIVQELYCESLIKKIKDHVLMFLFLLQISDDRAKKAEATNGFCGCPKHNESLRQWNPSLQTETVVYRYVCTSWRGIGTKFLAVFIDKEHWSRLWQFVKPQHFLLSLAGLIEGI